MKLFYHLWEVSFKKKYLLPLMLIYILAQLVYLIGFTEERILFSDTAFQLFKLINEGYPAVITDRWPLVLQRIWPSIGLLMEVPLNSLIYAYSINIFLVELAILLVLYVRKSTLYCLIWLVMVGIMKVETNFWCPSDLLIGTGLGLILFSYLDDFKNQYFSSFVLGLAVLFSHPLTVFVIVFKLLFELFIEKKKSKTAIVAYAGIALLWIVKNVLLSSWYIAAKQGNLIASIKQYSFQFWEIEANGQLLYELLTQYLPMLVLAIGCIMILLYHRKYLSCVVIILFSFLHIQLVNYTNPVASPFYREASYLCIAFYFLYPTIWIVLKKDTKVDWLIAVIAFLMLANIHNTLRHADYFSNRLDLVKSQLDTINCPKTIKKIQGIHYMEWSLPYETLLISSTSGKSKTIVSRSAEDSLAAKPDIFLEAYKHRPLGELNNTYFILSIEEGYCRE